MYLNSTGMDGIIVSNNKNNPLKRNNKPLLWNHPQAVRFFVFWILFSTQYDD